MRNKRKFLIQESLKRKFVSRWFVGINIILCLLIIVSFNIDSVITFFGGDFKEEKTVLVIDQVGIYSQFEEQFNTISKLAVTKYQIKHVSTSSDTLKEKALDSNVIGIELLPDTNNIISAKVYTLEGLSTINQNIISTSLDNVKRELALKKFNITKDKMDMIEKSVTLDSVVLAKKAINESRDVSAALMVIVFVIPCFFLITTLVQMIGSEINEEKTTKSMEIIVSNVPAKDHLLAKIIVCTIFTFVQIFLLCIFVVVAALLHSKQVGALSATSTQIFTNHFIEDFISPTFLLSIKEIFPILLFSFVCTFITYALLAGVLASMTTNIDDFQQLQTPVMMIISLAFYLALLAALFEGSWFIKFMSFIPLIGFMVSPTLYILGQISFVSVIISSILEFLFLLLVYHYGIKIYRVGILNYSGDHLWRKIIKALKKSS